MKLDKLVLLSVALCAIVLAGELMAYGPDMHSYGADADLEDGSLDVRVRSSGSDAYSAIIMDNGEYSAPTQLYIYYDDLYYDSFEEVGRSTGLSSLDRDHAIDQITRSLRVRGFDNVIVCGAEELLEMMKGDPIGKGLLVLSYALPESIYSGGKGDLLFEWVSGGGSLYWAASPIGMFYHGENGPVMVDSSQELFFGKECMNMEYAGPALSVVDGDGLTEALALKWNRTIYGIDASGIEGARSMGFSQDGYSSVSMVPFGKGMICVVGGNYDRYQCDDLSQIIASGISPYSEILDIRSGSVRRGTEGFSFAVPEDAENISVYVSIGGYYTVFGRPIDV